MFLTLEGGDCSGKTTMSYFIKEYYESIGKTVVLTKEPGGTVYSTKIREILLNEDIVNDKTDPITQVMLLTAARIHHLQKIIIPALRKGHVVISDRYIDSTHVYQGLLFGKRRFIQQLLQCDELKILNIRPDYTFFYDIDFNTMSKRMQSRGIENVLDDKHINLKEKPIDCYKEHFKSIKQQYDKSIIVIDSNATIDSVKSDTLKHSKDCYRSYLERSSNKLERMGSFIKTVDYFGLV